MPVVAASRFEGDVGDTHLFPRDWGEVTVADEIPGVCRVRLTDGEYHLPLEGRFRILAGRILRPHVFGKAESRPRLRPTRVKSDMGDYLRNLGAGDAVFLRFLKMEAQRAVGDTLTDERGYRHQAAVAQPQFVGTAPHLTEKDIVVEFREFGGEVTQLVALRRLYYLFLCHNIEC